MSTRAFDILKSHYQAPRFKMPRKGRKAAKLWSLHPKLHDDVAQLLNEEGLQLEFLDTDDEEANIEERHTNVMGRFICRNSGCHSSGWSSKKIAITIRMYPRRLYNAPTMQKLQSRGLASPKS
jgi:hypothetical protein